MSILLRRLTVFVLACFAAAVFFGRTHAQSQSDLTTIWQTTAQATAYQFHADIRQTAHPVPDAGNVGRRPRTDRLLIDSSVAPHDERMEMTFTLAGDPDRPVQAKAENGTAYILNDNGEWEESRELIDVVAPGGDPLGYLNGMINVRQLDADAPSAVFPGELPHNNLTRYAFDIDGPAYAAFMRDQLQTYLETHEGMPHQLQAGTQPNLEGMTGEGELWVSADGLPTRQIVQLTIPAASGARAWHSVNIMTDFDNWQLASLADLAAQPARLWHNPELLLTAAPLPQAETVSNVALTLLLVLLMAAGLLYLVLHSRSRRAYRVFSWLITFVMLTAPFEQMLLGRQAEAFHARRAAISAETEARQTAQAEQEAAERELEGEPFQPNVSPFDQAPDTPIRSLNTNRVVSSRATGATSGSSTDDDGIDDDVEIYELGTFYDSNDSDGDLISDDAEIEGFSYAGQTWYLDPLNADTNGDGLTDSAECGDRINIDTDTLAISSNPTAACADTDGDGTPDVYDFDNDGDGVPDSVDLTPNYAGTLTTAAQDSFDLALSDYAADQLLEVEMQIRPTNANHLWLNGNVYDWPDLDTEGQVTRVFTDTLADHGYTTDNASNGDMMLIPALEITIPWDAGNPSGGLPISSTVAITIGTTTDLWLDSGVMDDYNVSVNKNTATGDMLLSIPVSQVEDEIGDGVVAWSATMPYRPDATTWGESHEVRLIWYVLALTDTCDDSGMTATDTYSDYCDGSDPSVWDTEATVIQTYYDDYFLTGLTLREDLGMSGALVAQNDAETVAYENYLWHLASGLQTVFLNGETLADGSRFDVGEIANRFDDDSMTYADGSAEKWGIPTNALNVTPFSDDTVLGGLEQLVSTELPNLLDTMYPAASEGVTVTVMQAHEEMYRAVSLADDDATYSGSLLTLSLANAYTEIYAGMSWDAYEMTASGWDDVDITAYADALEAALDVELTDSEIDSQLDASDADDDYARTAVLQSAVNFYLGIYAASSGIVQIETEIVGGDALDDAAYALPADTESALHIIKSGLDSLLDYIASYATVSLDGVDLTVKAYAVVESSAEILNGLGEIYTAAAKDDSQGLAGKTLKSTAKYIKTMLVEQYKVLNSLSGVNLTGPLHTVVTKAHLISVFVVMVVVAIMFLAALITDLDAQGVAIAVTIVAGIATSLAIFRGSTQIIQIYRSLGAFASTGIAALKAVTALQNIIRAWKFSLIVGFLFNVAVHIIIFFVTVAAGNLERNTVAYDLAVASLVGALIVEVALLTILLILFASAVALAVATGGVSLIVFGVVLILFAILALFDLVMYALCQTGTTDWEYACSGGATAYLASKLADLIYDYHVPIDFEHENRLDIAVNDVSVTDEASGINVGNQLAMQFVITSSLYADEPNFDYTWRDAFLLQGIGTDDLDSTIVTYKLQTTPFDDVAADVSLPASTDWQNDGGLPLYAIFTETVNLDLTNAALNESFSVYMGEAFDIPLMGCWVGVCNLDNRHQTANDANLGDNFTFDVFPATFDEFVALTPSGNGYRMAWDSRFPTLMDADGDGLISKAFNGLDPNDSLPDSDNDGLSDYFEVSNSADGYDPERPDQDNDGLIDYWEMFYQTDLGKADSDNDGLLDGEEVFHSDTYPSDKGASETWSGGWEIVYDYDNSGVAQRTWVTSEPLLADTDLDSILDSSERIYGYNPRVLNDVDVLSIRAAVIDVPGSKANHVKPGDTFNYTVAVESALDSTFASYGLIEAELPIDTVHDTQIFEVLGQQTVTTTGSVYVDPAIFTTSQSVSATLRAGAYSERADAGDAVTSLEYYVPMTYVVDSGGLFSDFAYPNHAGTDLGGMRCAEEHCPIQQDGYAEFVDDGIDTPDKVYVETDDFDLSTEAFSTSYWLLPTGDNTSGNTSLLSLRGLLNGTRRTGLNTAIDTDGETVTVNLQSGTDCETTTTATAPAGLVYNEWNHLVVTYDGNDVIVYLNGAAGTAVAFGFDICAPFSYPFFGNAYNGGMKDLAMYERALSSQEIAREYKNGFRLIDFPFDEPPGSSWYADTRGFGYYVTCWIESTCPDSGLPSVSNQALELDGDDEIYFNYVSKDGDNELALSHKLGISFDDSAAAAPLDTTFTIMAWISAESWSDSAANLLKAWGTKDSIDYSTNLGFTNGIPTITNSNDITGTTTLSATSALPTGEWVHVAFSRNATSDTIHIYIDGVEVASGPDDNFLLPGYSWVTMGDGFVGKIDHLVLVNHADSDTIQSIREEMPLLNLHADEDFDTADFRNEGLLDLTITCSGATCPAAGDYGQMREAPLFNGDGDLDDVLTVGGADLSQLARDAYSVALWVYPEDTHSGEQLLFGYDADLDHAPVIALTESLQVTVDRWTGQNGSCTSENHTVVTSDTLLHAEQWNHVIVSLANGVLTLTINGVVDTNTTTTAVTAACDATVSAEIGRGIIGKIDELAFYGTALIDLEAERLYDYQAAWYDVRYQPTLQIDADPPSAEVQIGTGYLYGDLGELLFVTASDEGGSDVETITLEINGETFDAAYSSGAWYAALPSALNEGTYTLKVTATDSVGHSATSEQPVSVDHSPPAVTLGSVSRATGSVLVVESDVTVTGTVTDTMSGFVDTDLLVRLDHVSGVGSTAWQTATVDGSNWTTTFSFETPPYGSYDVQIDVADVMGNALSQASIGSVEMDGRKPYADIAATGNVLTSTSLMLNGTVFDAPLPFRSQVLMLHFESAELLADSSGDVLAVTCTDCPAADATGAVGGAAAFDADTLSVDLAGGLDDANVTMMGWIRPTHTANSLGYDPTLFSNSDGGTTRFQFGLTDALDGLTISNGAITTTLSTILTANSWQHVAFVIENDEWSAYLNGLPVGSVTLGNGTTDDLPLLIGSNSSSNTFAGSLDEVIVFERALGGNEIYNIANPLDVDIATLSLRVRHLQDADQAIDDGTWIAITPDAGGNFSTWSHELTGDIEGIYKIDLQLADSSGFTRTVLGAWSGIIDTIAPDVTLNVTAGGTAMSVQCIASDSNLDASQWDCPNTTTPSEGYETASWYVDTVGNTTHLVSLTTGFESLPIASRTFEACDLYGNCAETSFSADCFVEYTGDDITDNFGDGTILQGAIDNAAGHLIKVAGVCTGVQMHNGVTQTLHISNSVTMQGGYTTTAWLDASQPDVYKTVISSGQQGVIGRITASGSLSATNLIFANGATAENGGGFNNAGSLSLGNVTVRDNMTDQSGGGIYSTGSLTLINTQVISNTATNGGGLYATTFELINSGVYSNTATNDGAGIYHTGETTISNIPIRGNLADGDGGGIYNTGTLTLTEMTVTENAADQTGGGVSNRGTLIVDASTFAHNSSGTAGGGVYNHSGSANLTLTNSHIYSNTANFGAGINNRHTATVAQSAIVNNVSNSAGGGLYNYGVLTLDNSTVSGNRALNDFLAGGGVYNADRLTMRYSTVVSNTSPNAAGQAGLVHGGESVDLTLAITGSIIAYHGGANCYVFDGAVDFSAENISDDSSCGSGTTVSDPQLDPLTDDGTRLPFHNPQIGSPAIDAIAASSSGCGTTVTTDQLGTARPQANGCDVGATEVLRVCGVADATTYTLGDVELAVQASGVGTIDCFEVRPYQNSDHPNAGAEMYTGFWAIEALDSSNAGATSFDIDLTVQLAYVPDVGATLCRYNGGWDCGVDSVDTVNQTITRHNVTGFSDWGVSPLEPTAVGLEIVSAELPPASINNVLLLVFAMAMLLMTVRVVRPNQASRNTVQP